MKKRILSILLALVMVCSVLPVTGTRAYYTFYRPGIASSDYVIAFPDDYISLNPTVYTYSSDSESESVPFSDYYYEGKQYSESPEYATDNEKAYRSVAYLYRVGDDVRVPAYSTMEYQMDMALSAYKDGWNDAQTIYVNSMEEWETSQTLKSLYLGRGSNRTGDYDQETGDTSRQFILCQTRDWDQTYDNSHGATAAAPDLILVAWVTGDKPGTLNGKYSIVTGANSSLDNYNYCTVIVRSVTNYIYYDLNGGSGTARNTSKQAQDSIAIAEAPTRTGYTFAGWNTAADGSGTTYQPGDTYGENAGMYLYAKWIPNKYDVTVISDHCTTTVNQDPATFDTSVNITAEPDLGYQVDDIKVYKTDDPTVGISLTDNAFVQPEYPVTVEVTTSKIPFAVEKNPTFNGSYTVSHETAGIDDLVTVTPLPDEGFELDDITVQRTDTLELLPVTEGSFTMVVAPVRVSVSFKNSLYDITRAPTEGGSFTVEPDCTIMGDTVVVNVQPDDGYRLKSLTVSKTDDETVAVEVTGTSFVMPAFPVTVAVEFELMPLEVYKSSRIENGDITISHTEACLGQTVTVSAEAAEGYRLQAVTVYKTDDETVTVEIHEGSFVMPGYPVTVHADFEKIDYTVSVVDDANEKGTFTVDKTVAQIGDTVTVDVVCAEGWAIRGIVLTDSSGNSTFVNKMFTMPADHVTVSVAYMVIPTYLITIPATAELGGAPMTIAITGAVMEEGVSLKVTVETDFVARTAEGAEKTFAINGGSVQSGDVVLTVEGGGTPLNPKSGSAELSLDWDGIFQYSGSYHTTLAFTIRVEDEGYDQTE